MVIAARVAIPTALDLKGSERAWSPYAVLRLSCRCLFLGDSRIMKGNEMMALPVSVFLGLTKVETWFRGLADCGRATRASQASSVLAGKPQENSALEVLFRVNDGNTGTSQEDSSIQVRPRIRGPMIFASCCQGSSSSRTVKGSSSNLTVKESSANRTVSDWRRPPLALKRADSVAGIPHQSPPSPGTHLPIAAHDIVLVCVE